jgi:hypothetical protein
LIKNLVALFFAGSLPNSCICQEENFYFHHINLESNLSESTNNLHVYRDSRNLVWISSVNGLNCFDGKNIRVYKAGEKEGYGLVDNNIQSPFFEDRKGNVWFSTVEAVNCFERNTGKIKHFRKEGITDYRIAGIQNNGNIWGMSSTSGNLFFLNFDGDFHIVHPLFEHVHWGLLDTAENGEVRHLLAYSYKKPGLQISSYKNNVLVSQAMLFDG